MYESMKEKCTAFHIYIFAFDKLTYDILKQLNLDCATIISLEEFETTELLEVKKNRTVAEYCWTCTPSTISYVLKKFNIPCCTYIDSDLIFYSDPAVLINELKDSGNEVLITEHRYSLLPRLHALKKAGRFCVQFISFMNTDSGLQVLEKWRTQCLDWCYSRYEDGKFGDQKYLDDWPETYSNIHILRHHGGGIAPWNLTQYKFSNESDSINGVVKSTGETFYVIFFHYQYVKFLDDGTCDLGWYKISQGNKKLFYSPYIERVKEIERRLKALNSNYKAGITTLKADNLKNFLKIALKKIFRYNIIRSF
jgi:hypothetical protein